MDKNNKANYEANAVEENINGTLTSESFKTYSALRAHKKKIDIRIFALYLVVVTLLTVSAIIFVSSIKTAYFNRNSETEDVSDNINIIKTVYDKNELIKVENVTQEISGLFDIPVGVKIIELDTSSHLFTGLKINDIIVEVSGKNIETIEDMNNAVENLSEENIITFTVYRNGVYKEINPFDESFIDE